MPKIIENIKGQLVDEARKQVMENGYGAMTIRSVSSACGIAVGTVYNYFPSKEMLVATFMLEDWLSTVAWMKDQCGACDDPCQVIGYVHEGLENFIEEHNRLFTDPRAEAQYTASASSRRKILTEQMEAVIDPICKAHTKEDLPGLSNFIVESLLAWTMQNRNFDDYIKIIGQIFK